MIVASLLLQENSNLLPMAELIRNVNKIYDYINKRGVNTVLTLPPNPLAILSAVHGLGFTTQKSQKQKKGKSDSIDINLEPKSDPKTVLALSYYSNVFFQNMVMDSAVAILL